MEVLRCSCSEFSRSPGSTFARWRRSLTRLTQGLWTKLRMDCLEFQPLRLAAVPNEVLKLFCVCSCAVSVQGLHGDSARLLQGFCLACAASARPLREVRAASACLARGFCADRARLSRGSCAARRAQSEARHGNAGLDVIDPNTDWEPFGKKGARGSNT